MQTDNKHTLATEVRVRMTPRMRDRVEIAARKKGLNMSAFIRLVVIGECDRLEANMTSEELN